MLFVCLPLHVSLGFHFHFTSSPLASLAMLYQYVRGPLRLKDFQFKLYKCAAACYGVPFLHCTFK